MGAGVDRRVVSGTSRSRGRAGVALVVGATRTDPSLMNSVTVDPGTAEPLGDVPVTVPARSSPAIVASETENPASCSRCTARSFDRPVTSGTWALPAPRTYRGSGAGSSMEPNLFATGSIAENHVRAGSVPPKRLPS